MMACSLATGSAEMVSDLPDDPPINSAFRTIYQVLAFPIGAMWLRSHCGPYRHHAPANNFDWRCRYRDFRSWASTLPFRWSRRPWHLA
jgi:hypothetical protein